jgi:Mg2+ and Co2+ transporter CorA
MNTLLCKIQLHFYSTRKYYIDELKSMLYEIDHDVSVNNDELFIQLILDVTSPCMPMVFESSTALYNIEALTRGFCLALHKERCRRMEMIVR